MKTANLSNVAAPDLPAVVKADVVEVHWQQNCDVVLHKAGCQHQNSTDRVMPFDVASSVRFTDDYYFVAPCANKAS